MNKEKMKSWAWENSYFCNCGFDDCHPNNHRVCYICGEKILWGSYWGNEEQRNSRFAWDIHHIKPVSKNGKNSPDNLIAIHSSCNRKIGNK